jgi:hypothetical protein
MACCTSNFPIRIAPRSSDGSQSQLTNVLASNAHGLLHFQVLEHDPPRSYDAVLFALSKIVQE